ncbi:MAG: YbaN family protein [Deltaproteobacteria bacterium]|nr:YbaN family protein [Deltaproteobacteria bacterium]
MEVQRNRGSNRVHRNSLIRKVLIVAGTLFVGLGIVGIFLPILPTTPFLLLAAACYARSSERFYRWLLNHRWFGKYIRTYQEGKGIPVKAKALSISLIWLTIFSSVIFVVHPLIVRIILIVIAIGVTIYLLSLPTLRE